MFVKSSVNSNRIVQSLPTQTHHQHPLPSQIPQALHSPPVARRRLKLIFGPSLVKEPVIYQLGRKFEIVTNIRRADVTRDQGWVLLEVSGEPEELEKGVEYLESRGVKVEPAEGDLVE